ncbi:unnamed protein product [Polarella glacialis]|uniref:Uncharacterized protein n=1 Tax=Polarella glacialis TaxID=89957 RepID=A0A813M781_POLGL|nr:unnamed protein product [Polarella glacialis]
MASFSCGVGIGVLATSYFNRWINTKQDAAVSQRHWAEDATALPPSGCVEEHCQSLDSLVGILWPRVHRYMSVLFLEQIGPSINDALPSMLKGSVKIQKATLGKAPPRFSNIILQERADKAIVLEMSIALTSDLDVQTKAMHIPIGLKRLKFNGKLSVVLRPESGNPPFFGGVEIFFVDPPTIDMDFTGAADTADLRAIRDSIRSVIANRIANRIKNAMVIPARIAIDLDEENAVDIVDLKYPDPVGILRVLVRSATNLRAADMNLLGPKTSDPYVIIEVGQQKWRTSVVSKTLNPVWEHGNVYDFLVYERRQHATLTVMDADRLTADDLLGQIKEVCLEPLTRSSAMVDMTLPVIFQGQQAGILSLSTRWFSLIKEVPVQGIHPAVAGGPSQLVLSAKFVSVGGSPKSAKIPFVIRVKVDTFEVATKRSTTPAVTRAAAQEMDRVIQKHRGLSSICRWLRAKKMPVAEIAQMTGVQQLVVEHVLSKDEGPANESAALRQTQSSLKSRHQLFREILRLSLPWTEKITSSVVEIEMIGSDKRRVGNSLRIPLSELIGKEANGPFALMPGLEIQGRLSVMWLSVPT